MPDPPNHQLIHTCRSLKGAGSRNLKMYTRSLCVVCVCVCLCNVP